MNLITKEFKELTSTELYEILKARAKIFIIEQNINYLDPDGIDYQSLHCFYMETNKVVAYLRAFYTDDSKDIVQVGRVLTLEHGKGIGKKLLKESIMAIKEQMPCKKITMHAQKHAKIFYEKLGFIVTSEDFIEEGIVHVTMELTISN